MRRAKIVCTLGPAVSTPERIRALVDAGMDVARLNLSHGSYADHEEVYRQIRQARTGLLFSRLPALEVIGRMNRTSVTIGVATLVLSLALGLFWAERVWPSLADPKIVWAAVTLIVYGFLLWMDRRGWAGPRVAVLSIFGFGVVLFSYTVVNLYLSRAHDFR